MKLVIFVLFIYLLFSCSNSQNDNLSSVNNFVSDTVSKNYSIKPDTETIESLKKYSYLLYTINERDMITWGNGTGFLIRYSSRLFLVSNYHVFVQDTFNQKKQGAIQGKRINFRYDCPHVESKHDYFTIDLKEFRKLPIRRVDLTRPDIEAYLIPSFHRKDSLYSIEKFIPTSAIVIPKNTELYTFGYPNTDFKKDGKKMFMTVEPTLFKMKAEFSSMERVIEGGQIISKHYFVANPNLQQGRSGSPVFFRSPSDSKFYFYGIMASGDSSENKRTYIVKYSELISLLKKKIATLHNNRPQNYR